MVFYASRYFLLKDLDSIKSFREIDLKNEKIKFFYSEISDKYEIKYIKKNEDYFCYTYDKTGLIDDLRKEKIEKEEYKKAKKNHKNKTEIISKKRFSFNIKNHKAYLDVYKKQFLGLVVLKIIFDSIEEANIFKLPEVFKDANEINGLSTLNFSKNLALYQNVSFMINQDEYFKTSKMLLPSFIDSYIGLKIVLFDLINKSLEYQKKYIDFKNIQDFYKMLYLFEKSFCLLKEFYSVFDENISLKLASNLKNIIYSLKNAQTIEILEIFEKNLYQDGINDLLNFLNEKSDFYKGSDANIILKTNILNKLRFHLNFFIKRLKQENISNNFFLIKIISEHFAKFLGIEKLKKLNKNLETLLMLDETLKMQQFIFKKRKKEKNKKLDKDIKKIKQKLLQISIEILEGIKSEYPRK